MMPKVSFGIIVLNGEPFIRYCIKQIYPFAHQIIVVEGAVPSAAGIATEDGHSTDDTLRVLKDFQNKEDPDNKMFIVTAENEGYPNGFWPGEKDEQSRAYAKRATGDYLWQVDVDEFYRSPDIEKVLMLLKEEPEITAVSFKQITFWGGLDYIVDGWYLRSGADTYHRLFRWGNEYQYITHRPPTVVDEQGRNLRAIGWMSGRDMARRGIFLYHYSLLFPKQVEEKCSYYGNAPWARRSGAVKWAQNVFLHLKRPFRVHNVYQHLSWLERFHGTHPEQIQILWNDIVAGRVPVATRSTDDIETLLESLVYRLCVYFLKVAAPVYRPIRSAASLARRIFFALWKRITSLFRALKIGSQE